MQSDNEQQAVADKSPQGNAYELYLLLHALRTGAINLQEFIVKGKEWAEEVLQKENP